MKDRDKLPKLPDPPTQTNGESLEEMVRQIKRDVEEMKRGLENGDYVRLAD